MPESFLPFSHGLYAETARPAVATPPLDGDTRTTVAIIGGGYTGLSTALHLAERGVDALVLEAEEPGFGASGRNGGQVNPGVYNDPDTVIADLGPEAGRRLLDFSGAAPDLVFDLIRRHGIACEAEQTGTLRAAYHANKLASVRSLLAQLERSGSPARWMDAAALAEATGTTRYVGGIIYPQGGKLNPLSYARGLAEAAIGAGARVHGGSPATAIMRHGAGWRV
ncbi:MAG: FAD-dependent oxidoreductase, partial [Mesorhizobium sp.]|nr:FAD-dependent oxidoreductase [Mesorhizobium sp.]